MNEKKLEKVVFTFDKSVYEKMLSSLLFIISYADDKYFRLKKDYPKSAACWSGISTSSQFVFNAFNGALDSKEVSNESSETSDEVPF